LPLTPIERRRRSTAIIRVGEGVVELRGMMVMVAAAAIAVVTVVVVVVVVVSVFEWIPNTIKYLV